MNVSDRVEPRSAEAEDGQVHMRLSPSLKTWLRAEAEREHRTLTGHIAYLLERARRDSDSE